jgi:hypothetical protein
MAAAVRFHAVFMIIPHNFLMDFAICPDFGTIIT